MAQFHEHPDGSIYVRTPAGTYTDTRVNFIADFRWQLPAKPEGCIERLYDPSPGSGQDGRHALFDAKGNHRWSGPEPWELGDKAIAQIAVLLERQQARQAAAAPPQPPATPSANAANTRVF